MALIKSIFAYEIIDSRGLPTIEARLELDSGVSVATSVSGSQGGYLNEPGDVRDEDPNRFFGKGVLHAVSYINDLIAPKLKGVNPSKLREIDDWLIKADGTKNKSRLGTNTLLTLSQLIAKAGAADLKIPLYSYLNQLYKTIYKTEIVIDKVPTPIFNMINGGKHANTPMDFQEFQIIPSSSFTFGTAYQKAIELYTELKKVLEYRNATTAVGEEGGFSPNLTTNVDALEILNESITQVKMKVGLDMFLGIDFASSFFSKKGLYTIKDKPHALKSDEYIDFVKFLLDNYSILYIEDPFDAEDWPSWKKLSSSLSSTVYIVGDELIRMNKDRLTYAIKEGSCTSFLLKPNQIGTISEIFDIVNLARTNSITYMVAGRSSETNDDFIADLAVALQSEFVKFGAPVRGERVAKYNRLWKIERDELKIQQ
jgi:enolase